MIFQSLFKCLSTKGYVHCRRYSPRENFATIPIDNCYEVDESFLHSNVGDISTPYLICVCDDHISEEVRILAMSLVCNTGVFVRVECLNTKCLHTARYHSSTYIDSFLFEDDTESSGS